MVHGCHDPDSILLIPADASIWVTIIIPPCFNQVERGGILVWHRPSGCLSVHLSVRLWTESCSALYLQQCSSDPFHICTSYQAILEGVSHVKFVSQIKNFKFWQIHWIGNFDSVFLWLGIQYDSIVWVIMRGGGGSSERRRSTSCSSLVLS